MSQVSAILRRGRSRYFHWCPACEEMHPLPDGWKFNGNVTRPSFEPSFKQTFARWPGEPGSAEARESKRDLVCHYIIADGRIQFCCDSWHGRSDIVAMPPIPEHVADPFAHETQD
jgi:hypothetical protein